MKVRLAPQVVDFVRQLPPEPRKLLRNALRGLEREAGDLRPLEGDLSGSCRLRIGGYRIIFSYATRGTIDCIFAERRSVIYDVFADALRVHLSRSSKR